MIQLRVKYLLRIPRRTLAAASSLPNFPRQTASNLLADKVSIWSGPKFFIHPSIQTFDNRKDSLEIEVKDKSREKSWTKEVEK